MADMSPTYRQLNRQTIRQELKDEATSKSTSGEQATWS